MIAALAAGWALVPVASMAAANRSRPRELARPAAIPDITVLFGRALKRVHMTYPHARVLEADGVTRAGQGVTAATGIVSWTFGFVNQAAGSRTASVYVSYGPPPKQFGKVVGSPQSILEDVVIGAAPRMTLTRAVQRLRAAGHRRRFFNVTLRNPLRPKASNPLYIFGFAGNAYVAVDTVTGKVAPL
jgi:hypothetical protein